MGDTVGVVSLSSGLAHRFPHVFDNGLRNLHDLFDLDVKEYPTTRMSGDELAAHPELRARDLEAALTDPETRAVISAIGGEDSIRILPHLRTRLFEGPPKILLGFSDSTTYLTYANVRGWVTFNGPSVMAGLSQARSLPVAFHQMVRKLLFDGPETFDYHPFHRFSDGYLDFSDPRNLGKVKSPHRDHGWHVVQGSGRASGPLYGGCLEVLDLLRGTAYWPPEDFWDGRLLFLETSENKPPVRQVARFLRVLGVQGVFDQISGLLVGRARDYTAEEKRELDRAIAKVVGGEFRHPSLPILSNMDFGHTDPQWVLPLGVPAEVDPRAKTFRLLEPAVV